MHRNGYWSTLLNRRLSRRKGLALTGSTGLGAALLAACGGDEGGEDAQGGGLVSQPIDTTKQAKRGGVMKDRTFADVPTLDILTANNPWWSAGYAVYNSLVQNQHGYLQPREEGLIAPDLAESWEFSPDKLQITLKLRQNVPFHNKPPVNGRMLDMDDVMFSWNRFSAKYSNRAEVVNSLNPDAPVLSLTATDSRTLVMKLKEPLVNILSLFVGSNGTGVYMVPKETDTTLDLRGDMLGTGPWYLANYTPSVSFTMKRHEGFWDKDWALVEQIDLPIISEYASALAQLKVGNIYSMGTHSNSGLAAQEDILPLKRDEPRISIYQSEFAYPGVNTFNFGWLPEGKSPFLDERVRQAVSMSWNRDLFLDSMLNITTFESEGVPVESRWNTALTANLQGWWLDPQSKDFGPNARYLQHDLTEAKKLLAAAGYANGFETLSSYIPGAELGPLPKFAAVLDGFTQEVGIKPRVNNVDYLKEYVPLYRDGRGQYEGWSYSSGGGTLTFDTYWSKHRRSFRGFSLTGRNDQSGDPQVDAMIEKTRIEHDVEKRRALVQDLQRYLAKTSYVLLHPGMATGLTVAWPAIGNFNVWRGGRPHYRLWVDDSKAPFKTG